LREKLSMFDSALGALSNRLDANFLTAFWLPAFVATLANVGFIAVLVGPATLAAEATDLDSVEQTLAAMLGVVIITMLALLLRALALAIVAFFAGESLPGPVAEWSTRGQRRVRRHALRTQGETATPEQVWRLVGPRFPHDEAALRPTRFGNLLATVIEYPRNVYAMDGWLWWPHLAVLLPTEVRAAWDSAQAGMLGLLNLSLISNGLAIEALLVLGLAGNQTIPALGGAIGGVILGRLCYMAAVSQAHEVAAQIRVAFTLYRHALLRQLGVAIPDDVAAERALWPALTREMLGQQDVLVRDGTVMTAGSNGCAGRDPGGDAG
jgi:hypothetical protein